MEVQIQIHMEGQIQITKNESFFGEQTLNYSLAYLVVPNTEEQFSQPFLGLSKIWQLFQDPIII